MEDLTQYLVQNKHTLNLSEVSRRAGLSPQYLKHVVAGRRRLTPHAEDLIRPVIAKILCTQVEGSSDASR